MRMGITFCADFIILNPIVGYITFKGSLKMNPVFFLSKTPRRSFRTHNMEGGGFQDTDVILLLGFVPTFITQLPQRILRYSNKQ